MPSESIASFLDLARENNLLGGEDVEALFQQPDVPQQNLAALCDFLQNRGVLTEYQATLIRAGKGYELNFAGYPILGELGPCPGGTAYKGTHPSLRTPVVIRRLRTDWFAPHDNASAYIQRAQDAAPAVHPHLAHLLDAGVAREEPFAVLEPFDSADLETLIGDIGPMPAALATEFVRQAASALQLAHLRGFAHGDVRPANLRAGPLVASTRPRADGSPRYRPAPTATIKLFELGLVPNRPAIEGDPYRAPEAQGPSPEADIFALGGALAFLLTGKPPTAPALLHAIRPDAPMPLVELAAEMMSAEPNARPTATEVLGKLAALSPGVIPAAPKPYPLPESSSILGGGESEHLEVTGITEGADVDLVEAADVELASVAADTLPVVGSWPAHEPYHPPAFVPAELHAPQEWGAPAAFDPLAEDRGDSTPKAPRAVPERKINKTKVLIWITVGLFLNALAIGIWASLYFGFFEGSPKSDPTQEPKEQKPPVNPPKPNKKGNRPPV